MTEEINTFSIAGEPQIVFDVRKHILNEFKDLEFQEEGHIYHLHGKQLCSASSIYHRFQREVFDEEKESKAYAKKHGKTPEYWLREWKCKAFRATTLGTRTHAFGESLGYLRAGHPELICPTIQKQYCAEYNYLAPLHPKEESVIKFMDEMPRSYHLVLNEAKAYSGKNPIAEKNLKEQICGTFDMLYYDEEKKGFLILDYKTNRQLMNDYNRRKNKTLLPPFNNLIEEELNNYAIQLSLYALMLEDIGINIIDRQIIWLKDVGEYENISLPDLSKKLRIAL